MILKQFNKNGRILIAPADDKHLPVFEHLSGGSIAITTDFLRQYLSSCMHFT